MSAVSDADVVLHRLVRGCWPALPALLVGSAAVCAAATVVVLAAPGLNAVSIALSALLVAPGFAAVVATVDGAPDDRTTIRDWVHAARRVGPIALRHAVVPVIAGELFLAAWLAWSRSGNPLLLPSLGLTGAATLLALMLYPALLVELDRATPARRAWWNAAVLVARRPVRFAAAYCLAALGVWLASEWSVSVLLLVPAPVALVLVAARRTTEREAAG